MPVETSTFFWNFKAIFDHWCLHWFTIDSCRYRSRCCSGTRRDTFFSRRVESLNSGVWFCCHAPASGHIIFAIQGRPVSDSVTWFCVVTCPERKLKRYSGEQSLSQAGAEASDPWNFPSRGDVERFQWNFTKGRSSNQIAKKRGNANLAGQSLLGLGHFSVSQISQIMSKLPQQEKRAVLPFDQVFKALKTLSKGRTGPGRIAMNHWNSLFHRWLESQEHICRPVLNSKWRQYNNMKKAQTFLQLTCWLWKCRTSDAAWTQKTRKLPRRGCLFQGIDAVSTDMMWTWCYFVSHCHYHTTCDSLPSGPHDSDLQHPRKQSHFWRSQKRMKSWIRLNLGVDWQGSSA